MTAFKAPVDREGLEAALAMGYGPDEAILQAARLYLAQLPTVCETCGGKGYDPEHREMAGCTHPCPSCHGSGKVYPAELVERIARALQDLSLYSQDPVTGGIGGFVPEQVAVAVLDALNGINLEGEGNEGQAVCLP